MGVLLLQVGANQRKMEEEPELEESHPEETVEMSLCSGRVTDHGIQTEKVGCQVR